MRRFASVHEIIRFIAGGLRTPDARTTRLSTHPASVGRRLSVLSACIALLLMGCDDKPSSNAAQVASKSTPDTSFAFNVADANRLTALRLDAAERGKVLVIDCWATWCGSCVAMFPHLHEAIHGRGQGVMLVSLSFDEGQASIEKARRFLAEQQATDNAYRAADGSDAKDAIAKALSDTWDGGALPAVFVYNIDGSPALEFTETRGEVKDWVGQITVAVDRALQVADDSSGQ